MSLYVGHVPPHVRRDDIERVFQRFGRCNVQLKSGYGFVVYDVIANAERALHMMRGKIICGEQLSLGWSNRQPKPHKSGDRSIRTFEPYSRRQFKEIHDGVGPGHAQGQRDFEPGSSHARAFDHSGNRSDYASDREAGNIGKNLDNVEEGKDLSSKEGLINEINPVENDRWGEPLTGLDGENHNDFDRYEPYRGLDISYEGKNQIDSSFSSPEHAIPYEKVHGERSIEKTDMRLIKRKTQQVCYRCGVGGHIARECKEGDARRERFGKYKHKREEVNFRCSFEGRLKRLRYNSFGRPVGNKDPSMLEKYGCDREKSQLPITKKVVSDNERSPEAKEKHWNKHRAESRIKKEKKDNHGTTKKAPRKRRKRRSDTSSLSSNSSTDSSRSDSQSIRSISDASQRSSSRSRSAALESANSLSRSASKSSDAKSVSSTKSRPRSRGGGSPNLSISLNQDSPFYMKSEPVDVPEICPNNKFDYVASAEKSELVGSFLTYKDENALAFTDIDSKPYGHNPTPNGVAAESFEQKEWNPSIGIPKDAASPGKLSENNLQGSSTMELSNSTTIPASRVTAQELFLALRHYGLATPDEGEPGISTEKYFGAARLWPWEIIYFRRMKKGAISTENYDRRLEQNREFGIVDKYIRSSSGWGECDQRNASQVQDADTIC